jgi:hypothetical protein
MYRKNKNRFHEETRVAGHVAENWGRSEKVNNDLHALAVLNPRSREKPGSQPDRVGAKQLNARICYSVCKLLSELGFVANQMASRVKAAFARARR